MYLDVFQVRLYHWSSFIPESSHRRENVLHAIAWRVVLSNRDMDTVTYRYSKYNVYPNLTGQDFGICCCFIKKRSHFRLRYIHTYIHTSYHINIHTLKLLIFQNTLSESISCCVDAISVVAEASCWVRSLTSAAEVA